MAVNPVSNPAWQEPFERDGFAIIESVLTPDRVAELIEVTRTGFLTENDGVLRRGGEVYGVRDLVWRVREIRQLSRTRELLDIVEAILGQGHLWSEGCTSTRLRQRTGISPGTKT